MSTKRFALAKFAVLVFGAAAMFMASRAASSAADVSFFRSPTGNIGCVYDSDPGYIRCDVRGGVQPLPPAPKDCEFDWGQGFTLHKTGKANIVCAGDTTLGGKTILAYGTTFKRGALSCASSTAGFRCKNADGHGFFISKGEAYRF
jgi:hypothetical protein